MAEGLVSKLGANLACIYTLQKLCISSDATRREPNRPVLSDGAYDTQKRPSKEDCLISAEPG